MKETRLYLGRIFGCHTQIVVETEDPTKPEKVRELLARMLSPVPPKPREVYLSQAREKLRKKP